MISHGISFIHMGEPIQRDAGENGVNEPSIIFGWKFLNHPKIQQPRILSLQDTGLSLHQSIGA
jgi:hypothetical protein